MTDRRTQTNLPPGLRNNNPGNILKTPIIWQGETDTPYSSIHEVFINSEYGLRALFKQIMTTSARTNGNPTQFAKDYTGANAAIVNNYANAIYTAIIPGTKITNDKQTIIKVAKVLVKFENGNAANLISNSEYTRAWTLLKSKNGYAPKNLQRSNIKSFYLPLSLLYLFS